MTYISGVVNEVPLAFEIMREVLEILEPSHHLGTLGGGRTVRTPKDARRKFVNRTKKPVEPVDIGAGRQRNSCPPYPTDLRYEPKR